MTPIATTIDMLATAFVFGTTVWFFFVQAPFMLKKMGREAFVPVQMMLTRLLGRVLVAGTAIMLVAALVATGEAVSALVVTAAVALFGALVNQRVLIPRALRAGGRGHREIRGRDADASTADFASKGVGQATARLHRMVVLFVVVMLAGVVPHALLMTGVVT